MRFPKYLLPISLIGSAVGSVALARDFTRGAKYTGDAKLYGRTVVITGANTGLGKETAKDLAKRGARVILACRHLDKAMKTRDEIIEQTFNKNVLVKKLDLASLKSIREFAEDVNKEKRIDILINNAGVMRCPKSLTYDGFEMQLGVNHMGHFLLTNLLLDKLKASSPSRVIVVSSIAHRGGDINFEDLNSSMHYDPAEAYQQSKLANILFTRELSKRLEGSNVSVNAVHPGIVRTDLGRHMGVSKNFISSSLFAPFTWLFMKKPEEGMQTILYCALEPSLEGKSGGYYTNCKETDVAPQAEDDDAALRLWLISEKWTQLS